MSKIIGLIQAVAIASTIFLLSGFTSIAYAGGPDVAPQEPARLSLIADVSGQWVSGRNSTGDVIAFSAPALSAPMPRLDSRAEFAGALMLMYMVHERVYLGLSYMMMAHHWARGGLNELLGGTYNVSGYTALHAAFFVMNFSLVHFNIGNILTAFFVGGGVGASWAETRNFIIGFTSTTLLNPHDSSAAFAYFVSLGLIMRVSRAFWFRFGARYINWGTHTLATTVPTGANPNRSLFAPPRTCFDSVGPFFALQYNIAM